MVVEEFDLVILPGILDVLLPSVAVEWIAIEPDRVGRERPTRIRLDTIGKKGSPI
jgi:hypothetical protein